MRELWIGNTNFYRIGYGFWGSAWEWVKEFTLCPVGRHEDQNDGYCHRCGSVLPILNDGKTPFDPKWEMSVGTFTLPTSAP